MLVYKLVLTLPLVILILEIKPIISWLVCCRVVHGHGMPRLGIQGLMLWGNCWIVVYWAQKSGWKKEGQNCWDSYVCIWKVGLECLIIGVIQTRYLSFLARESKCMPWDGIGGVCRMVLGCTQLDEWKVSSANWCTEWRRLPLGWGCLSMLRSL